MPVDLISAVGLITSASQLVGQAFTVIVNLQNYKEAIKKAPKHSAELRHEIGTLWNLLKSLEATSNNTQLCSVSLNNCCQELESMLDELNE